jgi:hypothetical protein
VRNNFRREKCQNKISSHFDEFVQEEVIDENAPPNNSKYQIVSTSLPIHDTL